MAVLTEEQGMLQDAARDWTRDRAPLTATRKIWHANTPLGYDPAIWQEMAQMGWAGVIVPESYGGADFGYLSLGLVIEELGRSLTPSPLISSALGGVSALLLGGTEAQKQRWLPGLASGEILAALAVEETPHHAPLQTALHAEAVGDGWVLSGVKRPVLDGVGAHIAIVAARTSGAPGDVEGITLFLVETDAPGLDCAALSQIDARNAAIYRFNGVRVGPESVLGPCEGEAQLLDAILDRVRIGVAAEMLGGMAQAFEITLDYLRTRVQFDQKIGTFQALQHRAVEMYGQIELTRSTVEAAFAGIDANAQDLPRRASLAKVMACETFHLVSNEMVQMHGGIGMTEEHDAGLFLKRARSAAASYGGASFHRERFGQLVGC